MPWNEPGGSNKDPWSSRGGDQGPPDLDEILRKFSNRLGGIFGGGGGGRGGSAGLILVLFVVAVVWLFSGFYLVSEGERAVVLRFGAYQDTKEPGLQWHIPFPIEKREIVNIDQVRSAQHRATMLTQDENIVDIELSVQYRVKNAEDYTFNVRLPDALTNQSLGTLYQVMESAVREIVGKNKMDFILGEGRAEIAASTQIVMQGILDEYRTGLQINTVNLQQAQPPEAVQGAFADAIKAREDEVRFRNEAESYANSIIPEARGQAARLEEESNAYKEQVIAQAEGEAARFTQLLREYEKAPRVTRERLYLDAFESVLSNSSKVIVDVEGGNNLMYLPLDKLMQGHGGAAAGAFGAGVGGTAPRVPVSSDDESARRRSLRTREVR